MQTLGLSFEQIAPNIDETPQLGEAPQALALRLARTKASDLAAKHPTSLVIGSDQVGVCKHRLLKKPKTVPQAIELLRQNAGNVATFYTALVLARSLPNNDLLTTEDVCITTLKFRELSLEQISRYVIEDQPLDSAGAFKAESLGITLFEYIRADDPSALIGLPLIALTRRLSEFGFDPLSS